MMTAITALPKQKKRDLPAFSSSSSETLATWSFQEKEPVTMSSTESHYGIIRWYDPITGRWLSNDPIGINGGLNQYVAFGNNREFSMKKIMSLIVVCISLLSGCSHLHTVSLHVPEDYSPPEKIPFSSISDREAYIASHRRGWLGVATNVKYTVNLKEGIVIIEKRGHGLYREYMTEAESKGLGDGLRQAESQLHNLADRVFEEAGRPPLFNKQSPPSPNPPQTKPNPNKGE